MTQDLLFRICVTWLLFIPIPIINGVLRERWYVHKIGPVRSGQIGCLVLAFAYLVFAFFSLREVAPTLSSSSLLSIGSIWLVLTLLFEFSIGLLGGRTWSVMLEEYDLAKGKLWPLVLLCIFLSPFILHWIITVI